MESDFLNLCRVCLNPSSQTRPLFDPGTNNLAEKINFCTGVEFFKEAEMSSVICELCYLDLETAFNFKTKCQIAQEAYKKFLKTMIKEETFETANDDDDVTFADDDVKEEPRDFDDFVKSEGDSSSVTSSVPKKLVTNKTKKQKKNKCLKRNQAKVKTKELCTRINVKKKKELNVKEEMEREKEIEIEFKIVCNPCGIEFLKKEELAEHKKEFHKECWVCEVCGKVFPSYLSSYSHLRSHQTPQFACNNCDYKTNYRYDLVKHIRIHTDEKRYQCEFCTRSFHTISNLRDHTSRHHSVNRQRRFACHLCDKRFYDNCKLKRHVDAHNNFLRYECELCHTKFARRNYWKEHLLKQHDIKIPPIRPGRRRNDAGDRENECSLKSVLVKDETVVERSLDADLVLKL